VRRSTSPSALVAIRRARTGGIGRLAGFTNPKPERQLPSGLRPFARLRSAKGRVYSHASEFLARISEDEQHQRERVGESSRAHASAYARSAWWSRRLRSFTMMRFMPAIFIAPIWRGRNTPPAVD
jgi:hypothetical protein